MPRPDLKPGDFCVVETANSPANNGKIVGQYLPTGFACADHFTVKLMAVLP